MSQIVYRWDAKLNNLGMGLAVYLDKPARDFLGVDKDCRDVVLECREGAKGRFVAVFKKPIQQVKP